MSDLGKISVTHGGNWNSNVSYEINTMVRHNGATYMSLKDSIGQEPTETDTEYWYLISKDGATPTVDSELSDTSINPVQNKVVKANIDTLKDEINKNKSNISFSDHDTATSGTSFTDAEDGNMLVTDWTKNLFNPTLDTTTKNGVTCTNNGDGTYTLDGTASITTYFIISGVIYDKNIINKYEGSKLAGAPSGSSYESFYLYAQLNGEQSTQKAYDDFGNGIKLNNIKGYETLEIIICVKSGKTVSNLTFKPMITTDLSATYDDFVPYGGYEIQSCGKNLLDNVLISVNTMNIEAKLTNDAGIKLNGTTPSGSDWKDICVKCKATKLEKGKTYCLSVKDALDGLYIILRNRHNYNAYKELNIHNRFIIFTWDKDDEYIRYTLTVKSQQTFDNVTIYPQLEEVAPDATEPTDFEPYTGETITVTNETESPAFGLKSHKGITNIISPGNVKCVYPTNESGVSVLEKERQLDDNKSDVVIDKSTGNKVVFTIENGIICAREA